jgi:hypothetical protein
MGSFNNTGPGWKRCSNEEVEGRICALSGVASLAGLRERVRSMERGFLNVRDGLDSVITAALADQPEDTYLQRQVAEVRAVEAVPAARARKAFALVGQAVSRDPLWDSTWQASVSETGSSAPRSNELSRPHEDFHRSRWPGVGPSDL